MAITITSGARVQWCRFRFPHGLCARLTHPCDLFQAALFDVCEAEDAFSRRFADVESMEWVLSQRRASTAARLAAVLTVMEKYLVQAWVAMESQLQRFLFPRCILPLYPCRLRPSDAFTCELRNPGVAAGATSAAVISKRVSESQERCIHDRHKTAPFTTDRTVVEAAASCLLGLSRVPVPSDLAAGKFAFSPSKCIVDEVSAVRLAVSMTDYTHAALQLLWSRLLPPQSAIDSYCNGQEFLLALSHNAPELELRVCVPRLLA